MVCDTLANLKAEKQEIDELHTILSNQANVAATGAEITATTNSLNSEMTQKLLDLRSELFTRVTELNSQTMDIVSKKVN